MKNKQWILAWLSEMDRLAKAEGETKGQWMSTENAFKMLMEAENILRLEIRNE